MLCPECGFNNPEEMNFCGKCATKLTPVLEKLPLESESSEPEARLVGEIASVRYTTPDFVGRQREMGELISILDDALSGKGHLAMLVGEPGIGKSRTAHELAVIAESQGAEVIQSRCHEQQDTPPYWPWVQAIHNHIEASDEGELRAEMGDGVAYIAEIIPEISLEPHAPPLVDTPEHARFRVFNSVITFLKNASRTKPIVIVLEDLQWADRSTLHLLVYAGQEIGEARILIIGTYRDVDLSLRHPLSEALGQLTRENLFQRIALRGLSHQALGDFVQATINVKPSNGFVDVLYSHTEGNPLFVTEVVRMLRQEGKLTPERLATNQDWDFRIPEGVREVIGMRLNRLSEDCRRVLIIASVIGSEFGFQPLLRTAEDISEDRLLDIVEEALDARVIEEISQTAGLYQFTHTLIRQTLQEELSTTRRVRLHGRIAQKLEELYGAEAESHAVELAYHFAEAQSVMGIDKLTHYSAIAGRQAYSARAWEEALSHIRNALEVREGQPVDAESASLLALMGRVHAALLHWDEAVDSLSRAFEFYAETGDVAQVLNTVNMAQTMMVAPRISGLLSRALALAPSDSEEIGSILSLYGYALGSGAGDYPKAKKAFDQALVIAERDGDEALLMRTLAASANVDGYNLHWDDVLDEGLKAIELSDKVEDALSELRARLWVSHAYQFKGELGKARRHIEIGCALAERLRDRYWLSLLLTHNYRIAWLQGDWRAARNVIEHARTLILDDIIFRTFDAKVEYEAGNFEEGDAHIESLLDYMLAPASNIPVPHMTTVLELGLALQIRGAASHLDIVLEIAQAILAVPSLRPNVEVAARGAVGIVAIEKKSAEMAEKQYITLKPHSGILYSWGGLIMDRLLGLLAQTMGRMDAAATHFEDALELCRRAGVKPELAWTCYDYASLLHEQGQRDKALSLLEEALDISTELGMKPLMEKATALKEKAEAQPARRPVYPDSLTQREVEVLRLIAAGKSNREIAEELFISVNTVIRHSGNIFAKTNTANRTEAAIYASKKGLAS